MNNFARGLTLEHVPIDSLKPNDHNARTHNRHQRRKIAASIRKFGFLNPILIDGQNRILAGHGRWEAAKDLELTEVPVIRIEHLSADEIRAYIIADNRLAELAGWDNEMLAIELQHLVSVKADFDVTITGFEVPEIDLIIGEEGGDPDDSDTIDIDVTAPAVSKAGDLWQLGKHRLLCGDAGREDAYVALMQGTFAHLVFVDPPYNLRINGHVSGLGRVHHREFAMASGEMDFAAYLDFLKRCCSLLALNCVPGAINFICTDWSHVHELLDVGATIYHELKNICVWVKDRAGMGAYFRGRHEFVCVFKHGSARHRNNVQLGRYGRDRSNVWQYPSPSAFGRAGEEGNLAALHPTVKPVQMVADAILDSSARGEIVLDSFLGSGTTLIAAERVGRVCYGMEIDSLYVDIAIRRWQRHTGDDAIHAVSGRRFNEIAAEVEALHV